MWKERLFKPDDLASATGYISDLASSTGYFLVISPIPLAICPEKAVPLKSCI